MVNVSFCPNEMGQNKTDIICRSGTQLQEAHNDQKIEGTYKTMLKNTY